MADEVSYSDEDMSEEEMENYKRPRLYDRLPIQTPPFNDYHKDEIQRLAARKIPPVWTVDDDACYICYSKDHPFGECPCEKKIPSDINVLTPEYDWACRGCGKLGMECCSEGSYAVRKQCSFCLNAGHWYWEERCPTEYRFRIRIQDRWRRFKEGKSFRELPLQIPRFELKGHLPEVFRLAKRKISKPVGDGCCSLCYARGHPYYECPYMNSIPEGMVVGPDFDQVCAGCGRTGVQCCGVGAYPTNKWCYICHCQGHWYWEDKHNPHHPVGSEFGQLFNKFIDKRTPKMEMFHRMAETRL